MADSRKRETPHGAVSERFMRHHYGASGFVKKERQVKQSEEQTAAQLQREKAMMRRNEPMLGDAIPDLIAKVKALLEWMPQCSPGSSGHQRRVAVEQAIQQLEGAWGVARL